MVRPEFFYVELRDFFSDLWPGDIKMRPFLDTCCLSPVLPFAVFDKKAKVSDQNCFGY